MRIIKHVYVESCGEIEGFFNDKGELLESWSCNDATWRGEYFDGLFLTLGIKIEYPKGKELKELKKKLIDWAKESFGLDEDDTYEEDEPE